jgi:hypothetical protein
VNLEAINITLPRIKAKAAKIANLEFRSIFFKSWVLKKSNDDFDLGWSGCLLNMLLTALKLLSRLTPHQQPHSLLGIQSAVQHLHHTLRDWHIHP